MRPYVEFKKQRELGEILSDTFAFIRNEFKPFMRTIFQVSGPYLVLFLLAMTFYTYASGSAFDFNDITANSYNGSDTTMMFAALFAFMITAVLVYTMAASTVLHYIKSYVENNGNVDYSQVKQNVKSTFWGFFGLSVLKWIMIVISFIVFCLPVFYMIVPMSVVLSIYVFEKRDIGDAFGYSFNLIKDEFWITFATIFVVGLIVMVASYAFALPISMYTMAKTGIFSGEIDPANLQSMYDPVTMVLNAISNLIQFLLNLISTVAGVFIYFNLNERKNFSGTLDRIKSIGQKED